MTNFFSSPELLQFCFWPSRFFPQPIPDCFTLLSFGHSILSLLDTNRVQENGFNFCFSCIMCPHFPSQCLSQKVGRTALLTPQDNLKKDVSTQINSALREPFTPIFIHSFIIIDQCQRSLTLLSMVNFQFDPTLFSSCLVHIFFFRASCILCPRFSFSYLKTMAERGQFNNFIIR